MKKLRQSRPFAIFILVLTVIFSVFFGTYRAVGQLQTKANKAYFNSSVRYGEAYTDMKKFGQYATMLNTIAAAVGTGTEFDGHLGIFNGHYGEPSVSRDYFYDLYNAAALAYNSVLASGNADEQQKISAKQYFYEMDATRKRLANNKDYNSAAENYNKVISSFPAVLIYKNADKMIVFN